MTIDEGNVSLLDPFTHTKMDEIMNFDFWSESQNKGNSEKVNINLDYEAGYRDYC